MIRTTTAALALALALLPLAAARAQDPGLPHPPARRATAAGDATLDPTRTVHGTSPGAVNAELRGEADAAKKGGPLAVAGTAGRMFFDPTFIGAIALNDLAEAGLHRDKDAVGDLGHSLETPDFYAGVGIFNASYMGANAAADRIAAGAGKTLVGKAIADKSPLALVKGGGFVKENLVLAAALTIPRLVQVDFGGITFGDVFHGNFSRFHPSVHAGHVDVQDLGITLGSFAVAQPLWAGVKQVGKFAAKYVAERLAGRLAALAVINGAALAVPVGGEFFDAAIDIGFIAWTAVDLAGLLFTAHQVEQPVRDWNDRRRFEDAAEKAKQNYLAVAAENGGHPDPAKLDKAISDLAVATQNLRDLSYLDVAIEDARYVERLQRLGVPQSTIDALGQKVLKDDGRWLAAPGQTAALEQAFAPGTKIDGVDQKKLDELTARHDAAVAKALAKVQAAPTVAPTALDPASPDFAWSQNRGQLYDEEQMILLRGAQSIQDPALKKRVVNEAQVVRALQTVDAHLESAPSSTIGLAGAVKNGTD